MSYTSLSNFKDETTSLDMGNGRILNNTAKANGGAIYGKENCRIMISGRSLISGNIAEASGGAMHFMDCDLTIGDNARIVSNTADDGGGIYLDGTLDFVQNKVLLYGNAEIRGNKDQRGASNIYLAGTYNMLTARDLGTGMNIGIRTPSEKTEKTQEVLPFDEPDADIVAHLSSDDERCVVGFVTGGVYLFANSNLPVYIHGVKGIDDEKPAYMTERNKAFDRPEDPKQYARVFDGWYQDPEFSEKYDFSTIVTDRVDLYAKWAPAIDFIEVKVFDVSKTEYLQGEELDLTFVYIYAYPIEGDRMMILVTKDMVSGFDSSQVGPQTLTVTYGGCSDAYDINISKAYEVEFDVKDLCDAPKLQHIPEYGKVNRPSDPEAKGYTFGGWFADPDCTEEYDFDTVVTENTTLYAKMTPDVKRISKLTGDCKTAYTLNEPLDVSGLKVIAVMTDYSIEEIPVTKDMVTGFDSSKPGNKTLTITYADKTINYDISVRIKITDMAVSDNLFYYDGKAHFPMASVFAGKKEIAKDTTDNENIGFSDLSLNVLPGTYTVKATGRGDYTGTLKAKYKIAVKPTAIMSLKRGKKSFKVKTKRLGSAYASGYQVRYSLKSSMKSAKTVYVGKISTAVTKTVKKLKKNKKYYVQVRTYKTIRGKKVFSAWSAKKSVKTK